MLVGRDAERARLQGLLSDAREGRSGVLVVSGEAGVGKNALLDGAAETSDGMRVVRVVGVESEATMPFGTLGDVCRPFLDSTGDLPDRQRQALEGALAMGPLFLSPRTIETHLGRVFRKLGISDRRALPAPSDEC